MRESKSIINNFAWRLAERFGAQGVTFVVSIVLARILDPTVYGTLALVTVFTAILQVFIDSGLGTALIQKKDADDIDFSSVFFFNIGMCILLYFIMFFTAPFIAAFYKMPDLTSVIRVLCLTLLVSGVKNVQQAYVSRNMLFKRFFFSTLGGTIGAAIIGILLAFSGFGVWALVAQYLFNSLVDTIILWLTVKWRPKLVFSLNRLKGLLSFGWKLLGVSLLSTIYNDMRSLLIGKLYTTENLAYYNKAQQFPQLIAINIDKSIDSILLPTMSQKQDDMAAVKTMGRLSIRMGTYVIMPIMTGLGVCAETLVKLVLTDKWLPSVPYIRIFCLSFALFSIFTTNYNIYKAIGKSEVYLKVTVESKLIGIVILLATVWFGVDMIAYGLLLTDLICLIICVFNTKKVLDYGFKEQLADFAPHLLLSLLMGAAVYCVNFLKLNEVLILFIQVIVGMVVYISLSVLTHNESLGYINKLIRKATKHKI